MPAKPLSDAQIKEAAKLRALFEKWQDKVADKGGKKPSQLEAAVKIEMTQGALNQYLNGKIPLNIDAANKFAKLMECKVIDFSENLHKELIELCNSVNLLNQTQAPYSADRLSWPFGNRISQSEYASLSDEQKIQVENRIKVYLEDNQSK